MKQIKAKIFNNVEIVPAHYLMSLEAPAIAKRAVPGQFVNVKCSEGLVPLLRRPFSIHRTRDGRIEILYKVIGEGTRLLARRTAGELLDIIGPLGHGFDIRRATLRQAQGRPERSRGTTSDERRATILVAGGMGVAPLVFLAEKLTKRKVIALIGAKTKKTVLCERGFKKVGAEIMVATEDGSKGAKGLVTSLLEEFLRRTKDKGRGTIYSCGPTPMLKEVARLAREHKIPCEVSLEERMACGIGVCLGCPVKVRVQPAPAGSVSGPGRTEYRVQSAWYKMVCKDGPVFNAEDIIWE